MTNRNRTPLCLGSMLGVNAVLLAASSAGQVTSGRTAVTISVDQPAYVGEPVWITATSGELSNVRFPFHAAMEDTGCNRIELKREGVLLPPLPIRPVTTLDGLVCGSAAPPGSPPHRLPLHAVFALDKPGTYSVRWTQLTPMESAHPSELSPTDASGWVNFELRQPPPEQREHWLTTLLANPPSDPGLLAGDFLPSLLAAVPDPRALRAYVSYLHDQNAMVSGMAAAGLEHFPPAEARAAIIDSIVQHGPSDELAYFATYHRGWTQSDETQLVHATVPYLHSQHGPSQNAAALKLLYFIVAIPNQAWPADSELRNYADNQVLDIAPGVIRSGTSAVAHELALYLGSMTSPRAHELLLQIADRADDAAEQARICLTWHPDAADLPHLAAVLMAPGDADPSGRDRSSLPYSLVKGYGDAALPYLERASRILRTWAGFSSRGLQRRALIPAAARILARVFSRNGSFPINKTSRAMGRFTRLEKSWQGR